MRYLGFILALALSLALKVSTVVGAESARFEKDVYAVKIKPQTASKRSREILKSHNRAILLAQRRLQAQNAELAAYTDSGSSAPSPIVSEAVAESPGHSTSIAITPMIGSLMYVGPWNNHIGNSYLLGLGLEVPLTRIFSLELEGSYADNNITYFNYIHDFQQYSLGGHAKFYLFRGPIRPFLGMGLMGLYYEDMSLGVTAPNRFYNQWVGAGDLLAGAEVEITDNIAVGGRAAWIVPIFNRPLTSDNGYMSMPGFEESAAINTTFVRLMGTVKVSF